jgi:hypothetical protein
LKAHGFEDDCKGAVAPYLKAQTKFAQAFQSEDPSMGGCPSIAIDSQPSKSYYPFKSYHQYDTKRFDPISIITQSLSHLPK